MQKSTLFTCWILVFVGAALGCEDTEFEKDNTCHKCHDRCVGCTGPHYYLGPGGCKMCTVAQKHIFGYPECLTGRANETCQNLESHYFEEASEDDEEVVYGYCKECHGLCAEKKGCVGPRVDQCRGCALAGMKHGDLYHCMKRCPPSHPVLDNNNVCQKKKVEDEKATTLK